MGDVRENIFGMTGFAREVMQQLFFNGPTWDGDIISKTGRGELGQLGYAHHEFGWARLTREGVEFAIKSMLLSDAKDKRDRDRRRASRPAVSADGIALILSEGGVTNHGYLAVKIAEAVESGDYLKR